MITEDKYGVIVQDQGGGVLDGGDSVNWEGHRIYLTVGTYIYSNFFRRNNLGYCRHPRNKPQHKYYKNPWNGNISRDQLTGILLATIRLKDRKEAWGILLHHAAWGFLFAYNTVRNNDLTYTWKWPDFTFIETWVLELRALGPWTWPLLFLLDWWLVMQVIHFNSTPSTDPLTFAGRTLACLEYSPTPASVLAFKILDKKKLLSELHKYWCPWRKNCGMFELYRRRIWELTENT